jgi:hypothetical protein
MIYSLGNALMKNTRQICRFSLYLYNIINALINSNTIDFLYIRFFRLPGNSSKKNCNSKEQGQGQGQGQGKGQGARAGQ